MTNKYEQLFNAWKEVCHRLENLSSFVQNDLDDMLKEGYVTKQQIRDSIVEFDILYTNNKSFLDSLAKDIRNLLVEKSKREE